MNYDKRFKFESLVIWQKAMDLGERLDKIAYEFPKIEHYNLCSQLRRAGDSITLNISEGSIGQSNKEFLRFMGYAIRSLAEVITCLYKALNREYISKEQFNYYYDRSFELMNMMVALKKSLR